MPQRGKKYSAMREKVDRSRKYTFSDAVAEAIDTSYVKFNESMDVAVRLGVNPRHADQMVRGAVVLPNGVGKTVGCWCLPRVKRKKRPWMPAPITSGRMI